MSDNIYTRPSWDEYFFEVMNTVAKRATCGRGRSGCVIVKDNRILVTGYVGSPIGLPHCDQAGHKMKKMVHEDGHVSSHCVRTVHAEQNAICQAAKFGIPLEGSTLYCKMTPCRVCAMLIINCGIKNVLCERKYHDGAESEKMFKDSGIHLEYLMEDIQQYENPVIIEDKQLVTVENETSCFCNRIVTELSKIRGVVFSFQKESNGDVIEVSGFGKSWYVFLKGGYWMESSSDKTRGDDFIQEVLEARNKYSNNLEV